MKDQDRSFDSSRPKIFVRVDTISSGWSPIRRQGISEDRVFHDACHIISDLLNVCNYPDTFLNHFFTANYSVHVRVVLSDTMQILYMYVILYVQ